MAQSNPYCCPVCDTLPEPSCFEHKQDRPMASYLLDNGMLVIPIVKQRPIWCCGKWYNAPFYDSGAKYFEAIRDRMMFFAPGSDWIKKLIENGEMNVGRDIIYLNPKEENSDSREEDLDDQE